jgi:ATP-dependent DNA ligase
MGFVSPCLPSVATKPPTGAHWIHEIKHDGFRILVLRVGERVRVLTRNGVDRTRHGIFSDVCFSIGGGQWTRSTDIRSE